MILQKMLFVYVTHTHYIPCLALPWGQILYPKDNEIQNFGRQFFALHYQAFSFSYIDVILEKIYMYIYKFKLVIFDTFYTTW
jgi:hypothetical protein